MSNIGDIEKKTQQRVIRLLSDKAYPGNLGYEYLGNWEERDGFEGKGNRNIEPEYLRAWLKQQGVTAARTVKGISITQLRGLPFSPPISEQTAIAGVLADMDAELGALAARLV